MSEIFFWINYSVLRNKRREIERSKCFAHNKLFLFSVEFTATSYKKIDFEFN